MIMERKLLNLVFILVSIYGVTIGMVTVWKWPWDPMYLFNGPALWIGHEVYYSGIEYFGPHTANDGFPVPWAFRIPQVFFLTSIMFWGSIGIMGYYLSKRSLSRQRTHRTER